MDIIATVTDNENVFALMELTQKAFSSTLEKSPAVQDHIAARKTFKFGSTDRHQLDVYYPKSASGPVPVLFFVYGGALLFGERTDPSPACKGMYHANFGTYFAQQGFLTVVADYRLAPHVKHPDGAQDVKDSVQWVLDNAGQVTKGTKLEVNKDKVFMLGASAGAAHVASVLLSPDVKGPPINFAGVASLGGCFLFTGLEVMNGVVDAYYENQEKAKQNEPTTIARTQKDKVKALPPWLLIEAENEPQFILKGSELFTAGLAENGKSVDRIPAKGHNHLSTTFVLGTGDKEGEKWAADFVAWAKKL